MPSERLRDRIAPSAIGLNGRIPASGPEKDQDNSSLASRLGYHLTSVSLPFSPLSEACLLSQSPSNEVTQLLHRWTNGDEKALQDLAPIVYEELRRLAHSAHGPNVRNTRWRAPRWFTKPTFA